MKSRPSIFSDNKSYKIRKVNELSKEGNYLKEKFYKSKISEGTKSIYGYKEFQISEDFKGYDRGFYETLKGSFEKDLFATYVREAEVGKFKNNKLNGFGARYITQLPGYDMTKDEWCHTAGFIGNFVDGLPNKKILYFEEANNEDSKYALTTWGKGELITIDWDYNTKDFDVRDEIMASRFWSPWPHDIITNFKNEKWWEAYKNEFLD